MTNDEQNPVPALPGRARSVPWRYLLPRALYVILLLATAATLPGGGRMRDKYRYREGDIARERVVAPYEFRVQKDETVLRREQEQAATSIPPVFVVDTRISSEALARFAAFQEKAMEIVLSPSLDPVEGAHRLRTLGAPLSQEGARALLSPTRARRVLRELGGLLNDLYSAGVVSEKRNGLLDGYRLVSLREGETEVPKPVSLLYDRREALVRVDQRAREVFAEDPQSARLLNELAASFLQPNVAYNQSETDYRRIQAQGGVPTVVGYVQKDELLVDANQKVDHPALLKLHSLRNLELARQGRSDFLYPPVARMLLMLLFIAAFATYLRMELPTVYRDNAMLAIFTLLSIVVLALAQLQVGLFGLSEFTVPLATAPLVVASLIEKRPALVFTLLLAVATTGIVELRAPFVPVAVMGGVTAVYSVSRLPSLGVRARVLHDRAGESRRHSGLGPGAGDHGAGRRA
jgi:membrane-associated HD superfamily phosphohydrolase